MFSFSCDQCGSARCCAAHFASAYLRKLFQAQLSVLPVSCGRDLDLDNIFTEFLCCASVYLHFKACNTARQLMSRAFYTFWPYRIANGQYGNAINWTIKYSSDTHSYVRSLEALCFCLLSTFVLLILILNILD